MNATNPTATSSQSSTQTPSQKVAALRQAVGADDAKAILVLTWKKAPPHYELGRPQLDQKPQEWFLRTTREQSKVLDEKRSFVDYDPEYTPKKHEALHLADLDPLPGDTLFADLADYPNISLLDAPDLRRPTMYVVVVTTPDGSAYFGKRMQGLHVLSGTRGPRRLLYDKGRLHDMEGGVATFGERYDWVLFKDTFFILNLGAFHQEFRDNKELQDAVEHHASAINATLKIDGYDDFVERCQKNPAMASKLARAEAHGVYKRPVQELKDYAAQHKLAVTWNGDSVVFDAATIESQWQILKLLDEDRLKGPLSGTLFDSNSKREVND